VTLADSDLAEKVVADEEEGTTLQDTKRRHRFGQLNRFDPPPAPLYLTTQTLQTPNPTRKASPTASVSLDREILKAHHATIGQGRTTHNSRPEQAPRLFLCHPESR
jgi:hypothetical protein